MLHYPRELFLEFWRVRSQHGLSSPTTNAVTAWSSTGRFTISSAPATPVSITIPGNVQPVEYSGAERRVDIQLSAGVPPGGATVALSSGTGFSIQTNPVLTTTSVTITATDGTVTAQWPITLTPAPAPTSLLVRPMSTTSGSQGVVTTVTGLGQDQLVQVSSSNASIAAVPSTATVFAGSGVGFFDIATAPVSAPTAVTISVSGGGVTLSHPLTVYPSLPTLTGMTVSPGSVVGGNPATGMVTLNGPAPAVGVHVNLGANQPLSASVPASVFIPAGASSATFPVTTFPSFLTSVQLSAQMGDGFAFSAITVNPTPPTAALSAVTINPTTVVGGSSSTGTVTLSAPAPSGGAVVALSDNSSAATVPASVTVPAGASSRTFTVTTTTVTTSTSVTITGSYAASSRTVNLTVNPGAPPAPAAPSLTSPANMATVSQPVTFDWSDVANAASYIIQIDNSSNFTNPLTLSQSVSVSQASIGGLPAQQLFWRVRGVNSAGANGPFSISRRFTVQAAPSAPSLSSVALNPTSVVGGTGATGTVTLTAAAGGGGLAVTLSSSNAPVASVPSSVTVASGATTAQFAVTTSSVTSSTNVTVTGTGGGATRTATLAVNPQSSGPLPAPSLLAPCRRRPFRPGAGDHVRLEQRCRRFDVHDPDR